MRQPELDLRSKPAGGLDPETDPQRVSGVLRDDQLDRRLRSDLEPSEDLVRRVTLNALSKQESPRSMAGSRSWAPALGLSLLLVLGLGGAWWRGSSQGPSSVISEVAKTTVAMDSVNPRLTEIVIPGSAGPSGSSAAPILHMSNENGLFTVSSAQGSRWVVLSNRVLPSGADGVVGSTTTPVPLDRPSPSDDKEGLRREI